MSSEGVIEFRRRRVVYGQPEEIVLQPAEAKEFSVALEDLELGAVMGWVLWTDDSQLAGQMVARNGGRLTFEVLERTLFTRLALCRVLHIEG